MPYPYSITRELTAAGPAIGSYSRLSEPVVLVTGTRGREGFQSARALFARLEQIGNEIRDGAPSGTLQAVWQGTQHVSEPGVQALECMVATSGLVPFNRASKAQRGGARALGTKYQWYFLSEYLGWQWQRT